MSGVESRLRALGDQAAAAGKSLAALQRTGLLAPQRPDRLGRVAPRSCAGARSGRPGAAAARWGDAPALHRRARHAQLRRARPALERARPRLAACRVRSGDGIAILCRNHRGFLDACFASYKLGLRIVFMNTEFAGPQIEDVCKREEVSVLVFDAEYDDRAPEWAATTSAPGPTRPERRRRRGDPRGADRRQRGGPLAVPREGRRS